MAYKLKINNKIFTAKSAEYGKITLSITDDIDVLFFNKWENEKSTNKSDYVRDIEYIKVLESGVLVNCFPQLNDNEDEVIINYDYKIINK